MNKIAKQLKAKRMAAGALNLASPEVKIHLESSESTGPIDAPVDVEVKELYETNSLVEEFMLLANISVAERIYQQFPQTAVLRLVSSVLPCGFRPITDNCVFAVVTRRHRKPTSRFCKTFCRSVEI